MEHRKKGRKLKRTASHKRALLSNLSNSLIKHKRIKTTVAKAKELRMYIEPVLNKAKLAFLAIDKNPDKYVHLVREVRKFLKEREAIQELFTVVAPKIINRNGGYTRVLKIGFRPGDGADEAIIELVDFSIVGEAVKSKSVRKDGEIKSDEAGKPEAKEKTVKAKTDKAKTDKAKTDKAKTDKAKTDKAKTDKTKSEKVKTVKKNKTDSDKEVTKKKKSPAKKDKKSD